MIAMKKKKVENYSERDWKKVEDRVHNAIDHKREIQILEYFHKSFFRKPLDDQYLDFSLEMYTFYRGEYHSKRESKFKSLIKTILLMADERIQMDNGPRRGLDGKFL